MGLQVLGGGSYAYAQGGTDRVGFEASLSLGVLPLSPPAEALRAAGMALKRAALTLRAGRMDLVLTLAQ